MKRSVCIVATVIFCLFAILPINAYAETYSLKDTDISIDLDSSAWYVFTRENIENNPQLEEIGVTYEAAHDSLYNNGAYMDALLINEDGNGMELFVRKRHLGGDVANLSNYDNDEVADFAKGLSEKNGMAVYTVYENNYKFAKAEYFDTKVGCYVHEYVTIVNKDNYTLTFQSPIKFSEALNAEIKKIVDSIRFDVDPTIKENKGDSFGSAVLKGAIKGAAIGGGSGLIIALGNKWKKKKAKKASTDNTQM